MRKIIIGSKFDYWLGVVGFCAVLIVCIIVFELIDASTPDGEILFYIILIFSTIVFLQAFYFFSRDVYSTIDLDRNIFIYGTAFYTQEVSMNDVKFVKKAFLRKAVIVEILGKKHRVIISHGKSYNEAKNYFNRL